MLDASRSLNRIVAELPVSHNRIVFDVLQEGHLPGWLGSAWRGLLGHSLKQSVCTTGLAECTPCRLIDVCPYPALFETRPPRDPHILRRYPQAPGPYVLRASRGGRVTRGSSLEVEILLFGKHTEDLPLMVRALILGAQSGIGESRLPLSLRSLSVVGSDGLEQEVAIHELDDRDYGLPIPLPCLESRTRAVIDFRCPLRLRIKNRYLHPESLSARSVFSSLLRRYSALASFFGQGEPAIDFKRWVEVSESIRLKSIDLAWQDLARRSSRQHRTIPMSGIVGRAELSGEALAACLPLLWLGQWLHVGKGTSMGLGRYVLSFPDDASREPATGD